MKLATLAALAIRLQSLKAGALWTVAEICQRIPNALHLGKAAAADKPAAPRAVADRHLRPLSEIR